MSNESTDDRGWPTMKVVDYPAEADAQREPELSNAEIAREVITDWHDYEKWHDPSMMPIPPFSGAQEQELHRLITSALDAKDTRSRPTVEAAPLPTKAKEIWERRQDSFRDLGNDDWRGQYKRDIDFLFEHFVAPTVEAAETCVNHCIHSSDYVENGTCRHNGRHGLCGHVCKFKTEERRQAFDDAIQIASKLKSGWDADRREHYWISAAEQIADAITAARDAAPTDPEKDSKG